MSNIDIGHIYDYVNGEIIDNELLEKLENDHEFMMNVIKYTKDKNMYKLCSSNVKSNSDFVLFMIDMFNDDEYFIYDVVMNYIQKPDDNTVDKIYTKHVLAYLKKYLKNKDLIKIVDRFFGIDFLFEKKKNNLAKKGFSDEIIQHLGNCFCLTEEVYRNDYLVLGEYAKLYIKDIYASNNTDVENELHKKFTTSKEILDYGINNYFIEYINQYDTYLANYVGCHIELLDEVKSNINDYFERWELFEKNLEYNRCTKLFDEIHEYFLANGTDILFGEKNTIYYIADKFGMAKRIWKYEYEELDCNYPYEVFIDDLHHIFEFEKNKIDLTHLKNLCDIFINNFDIKIKQEMSERNIKCKNIIITNGKVQKKD